MQLQAVLFDMDGTILDSAPDFIAVTEAMLASRGLPFIDEELIRQVVSGGARDMVAAAFDIDRNSAEFDTLRLEFLARYLKHCAIHSRLYEGIEPLFKDIEQAGIKWGIVTNKPVRFAEPIVAGLELTERSAVLVCPEHVKQSKPSPEPLLLASKQLAIAPEHILYVGDDQRDIESGNAAGCYTVAVRYGYVHPNDNPDLWGADAIVETVAELHTFIGQAIRG